MKAKLANLDLRKVIYTFLGCAAGGFIPGMIIGDAFGEQMSGDGSKRLILFWWPIGTVLVFVLYMVALNFWEGIEGNMRRKNNEEFRAWQKECQDDQEKLEFEERFGNHQPGLN